MRLPFRGRLARVALPFLAAMFSAAAAWATIDPALQLQLGNPSNAAADPANHAHYLVQRPQYALDYSDTTREPNWVSWDLTTGDVGGSGRSSFIVDATLPDGFYQVQTTDYSGSGYDRGHMCPSADRTVTAADNQQVFYMTNMVPQAPDNNQGIWANFESYCRSLASAGNEILIVSGPSGFGGSTIASGVGIPGYTWKIVLVVPLGPGTALSRITASTRAIAIKVPNIAGVRSTPWQNFVTSIAQIEADTGFTFLTALPTSTANALRSVVDGQAATGAPAITGQPANQTTIVGGSATFAVTASGDAPLTYQWSRDDVELPGATDATLALTSVQAADVGSYTVVVANAVGTATSNPAQLVVNGLPPTVTASPVSETVAAGVNVVFSVSATGSPTLTYQWRKDAVALPGATTSALALTNVQAADAGSYDVLVANSVTTVSSAAAVLVVNPAGPTITVPPASRTASTGSNAGFSVTATGSAPLTYQWRKGGLALTDGGAISGATTASLLLTGVSAANAGDYDVVVTNALGTATSSAATLTVNPPPPSVVSWNFQTADPTSGLDATLSGGSVSQGNNFGTTTLLTASSVSGSYTGASGANNAGVAARTGALNPGLNGSAYFEFTLTPAGGKRLLATGLSFGARSTSTGPQAFAVYTSVDGYAVPVATGTAPNDSKWYLYAPAFATVTGAADAPVTFRIYGYNGTGSASSGTANWRIDDLKLTVTTVFPPPVAPVVTAIAPANGAAGVPVTSAITVTFNEAVTFTGSWFTLANAASGPLSAAVTGGPTTFTLTPPSYFGYHDTVTVTVLGAQVVDQATGTIHGTGAPTATFATEAYVPPTSPTVTTQPVAQAVHVGDTVTFSVAASGTAPFSYAWRRNGTAVTGNASASAATLVLPAVTTADAGNYDCVVSNVAGSDVSHPAALAVSLVAPTITTAPLAQGVTLGAPVTLTVAVAGTAPFTYQWHKDGTALADATTAALVLPAATYGTTGRYDVTVTNGAGSATSAAAAVAVIDAAADVITWDFATAAPASGVPAGVAGGAVASGNNNGTTTLLTATSASSGYTGATGGNNAGAAARIGALNQSSGGSAYFEFTLAPPADRQFAATGLSFGMRSTSTGPRAFAVFSSVDNYAAPLATGTVPNNGAWAGYATDFSGVIGATGAPVTFRIYGYNGAGSPASGTANWRIDDLKLTAALVAVPPVKPTVTTQPTALTATVGDTVTFTVAAGGTAPLTYQWRKDGEPLTGNPSATSAMLTLAGITSREAGGYDCVVSNVAGSATSDAAQLAVNKAAATVTLDGLTATYDGTPHIPTVTTTPPDVTVVFTFDGSTTPPVEAGSYAVVATIDDPDYRGSASGTLVIAKARASVLLGNLLQTYDGAAKRAAVSTDPAGLPVVVTYDGAGLAPVNAGTYAVAGVIDDRNYEGSGSATLVIAPAPATVTLTGLVQAYDGTPKPATVTTVPDGLAVVTTYAGGSAAPTAPGSYAVTSTIQDPNYVGSATGTLLVTTTGLVRHAPTLNGGVDGSLQVLLPESMTLNGNAWVSGDLLVPGTPTLRVNGQPTYGGTVAGSGDAGAANYTITLNGGAAVRHVVTRTDAVPMPGLSAPPAPAGSRSVTLNRASDGAGDFATVRNLTLNGNAVTIAVPAGTYGAFTANSGGVLVLGVPGATTPAVYNLQALTLNGGSSVRVVGPVILNVAGSVTTNGALGDSAHPEWLVLNLAGGGLTLNSNATLAGFVTAPNGTVTLNGQATLAGAVIADRLVVNGGAVLQSVE